MKEIVMNVISEYGMQSKRNDVKIMFVSSDDFIVEGDKGRVAQVLSNLISNAIKFTSKGEIDISLGKSRDGKGVVVSVKDTGSGIDSDIMPRLFIKFVTRSDSGTGLGLYISKNIVETQGGKIWAENNSGGRGATFRFSIPMTQ